MEGGREAGSRMVAKNERGRREGRRGVECCEVMEEQGRRLEEDWGGGMKN